MSGTVVLPGRRLPSGRAPPGSGGGDLETWKSREDDPGGERGDGNDACTTVSTFDGDKKNAMAVTRFFARGRRFENRYKTGRRPKKVLTVGRRVKRLNSQTKLFLNKFLNTRTAATALSHSLKFQARVLLLPPRRRGDRQFTPGFRGTRHGFRPAKIRFVTIFKIFTHLGRC
ncbi:hypothetical protein Zmor_023126 [Zophobas morio]|uniref:Uncharacterized protein n=1 Tax=Zophobas morio TaxID=2755281 RepID=A0AA38HZ52_9CUCU|nr:hypothetical protein Zmor_023126 [Zophobas morio]